MMDISTLLVQLELPAEAPESFSRRYDESLADFSGLPEFMTMPFVERYYPWVGAEASHLGLFAAVAARVAGSEALQIYAHHMHKVMFVYPGCECGYGLGRWPDLRSTLGRELCGMFDFMVAMSAIPMWRATHIGMGIPEEFSRASAEWLAGTLRIYNSAHPGCHGIDRGQIYWLRFNIEGKLFRIGRFEYMDDLLEEWMPAVFRRRSDGHTVALCGAGWGLLPDGSRMFPLGGDADAPIHPVFELSAGLVRGRLIRPDGFASEREVELSLAEYEPVFRAKDFVPGMHIPGGGNMTVEAAYDSWRRALEFFPKYLGKTPKGIVCRSWIFNPSFERELPESNLAKLMREVYLFPERSSGRDGAFFIFGRSDGDFSQYPRDNSVRLAFHRIVERGETLKMGGMFILPPEIIAGNGRRYREELCTN